MFRTTLFILFLSATAFGQNLMVSREDSDSILLFDHIDGSLIDAGFITPAGIPGAPHTFGMAKAVLPGEIWLTVGGGRIARLTSDGNTFLGMIDTNSTWVEGMQARDGRVWITITRVGGTPTHYFIRELDMAFNLVAEHSQPSSCKDLLPYRGELLIAFPSGGITSPPGRIGRFDTSTASVTSDFYLGNSSTTLDYPFQMSTNAAGNLFVTDHTFPTSGVYELDPSGSIVRFIDTWPLGLRNVRDAVELHNGNLLISSTTGIHVYDMATGTVTTQVGSIRALFINPQYEPDLGTRYCTQSIGSSGLPALVYATGSLAISDDNLELSCFGMPGATFGYFITSRTRDHVLQPGGSIGILCLGGDVGRFDAQVGNSGTTGSFAIDLDFAHVPQPLGPVVAVSGETWHFSCWFRDSLFGQPTSNFAGGLSLTFE